MTATSPNTNEYGTTTTLLSDNDLVEKNDYAYTPEFDRQNNPLFKSFEPHKAQENPNLITQLMNSYFNHNDGSYQIFSYNPKPVRCSNNYSIMSNDFLNKNINRQARYAFNSVPIPVNTQNYVDYEIIPINEFELVPIKRTRYIKRTFFKYPLRKRLKKPVQITKSYYIPKDKVPLSSLTKSSLRKTKIGFQEETRTLSPIRIYERLEFSSPRISIRRDYPYDTYASTKVYSPRHYRINLSKEKKRKRKFY